MSINNNDIEWLYHFRHKRIKVDGFVKSRETPFSVIPAKAGIRAPGKQAQSEG